MPFLVARGISKRFSLASGPFYALKKTHLSFPAQGLFAIKGKSGSGKSTLLNLLSGIEKPSSGSVRLHGEDIAKKKRPLLGHEASMVFQHYNLIEGETVLYNVSLPLMMHGLDKKRALSLLRRFGLEKKAGRNVSTLSGGEKQRVAICRALATDPEIVFADEPTGALDEHNAVEVMDALKEISKTRLVLLVSHNEELIAQYADEVVELCDGKVISSFSPRTSTAKRKRRKTSNRNSWVAHFVRRNLRKNALKDTMCFLSGVVGFSAMLLSFGFILGNVPAMVEEQGKSLGYLRANVSRRSVVEIPGNALSLVKKSRPSLEESLDALEGIEDVDLVDDYGYFFPSAMPFFLDQVAYEPVPMEPIADLTLSEYGSALLVRGEAPRRNDFSSALVNLEFLDRFGEEMLGKTITCSSRSVVTYGGKQTEVFVEAKWKIVGALKEFGFLNTPRLYYSYAGLSEEIAQKEVTGNDGESISLPDLIESSPDDSPYGNYGRTLFLHDAKSVERLHAIIKGQEGGDIEITSASYSLKESFLSLSEAFTSSLSLFLGIALVGLSLILGMASYSSLVAGKKENAILTVLGARRSSLRRIYVYEAMLLCLGSSSVALALCPLLEKALNVLLKREFDVERLIRVPLMNFLGIPFLAVLLTLGFALLLGMISSLLPLMVQRHFPIAEELRDE